MKYLYGRISASQWLGSANLTNVSLHTGVLLRKSRGSYCHAPDQISPLLLAAVRKINAEVAFTMCTETIRVIVSSIEPGQKEVTMADGSQLQVVNSLNEVANTNVKKFQYGAIVRKENMLLIWHDDLQLIIPHAMKMEEKLLSLVSRDLAVIPETKAYKRTGLGFQLDVIWSQYHRRKHCRRNSANIDHELQHGQEVARCHGRGSRVRGRR